MARCFFACDLHGRVDRYRKLFAAIAAERPDAVLLGGDLLPHGYDGRWGAGSARGDFIRDFLAGGLLEVRRNFGGDAPRVLVILGNDDLRMHEAAFLDLQSTGAWEYIHGRAVDLEGHPVFGYACVPPTPFQLKDWERYDVSRYVDPGCVSPEAGYRSVPVDPVEVRDGTIAGDLAALVGTADLGRAVLLLHSPPYRCRLDRAALDGRTVDHVPLDVHVGSIAVGRFIEERQPLVTLHGHVHESARLTGAWRERFGRTEAFSAAHDGPELALVRFDTADPAVATRELL